MKEALVEARKCLVEFVQNHRQEATPHPYCWHCGSIWMGELHGHLDVRDDPPLHKFNCPVPAGQAAIVSIDAALKAGECPKCKDFKHYEVTDADQNVSLKECECCKLTAQLACSDAKGMEEERERCAKIAESLLSGQHTQGREQTFMAHYVGRIAAAIRGKGEK